MQNGQAMLRETIGLGSEGSMTKERAFYTSTGAVLLLTQDNSTTILEHMKMAYDEYTMMPDERKSRETADIIDETFQSNVTLIDLAWQRDRALNVPGVNPFDFGDQMHDMGMHQTDRDDLYSFFATWVYNIMFALKEFRIRLSVEAHVGEVTQILEEQRYGAEYREELGGQPHRQYDRIYLSNVPDYIGGTLATYLYAVPLTRPAKSSYIGSICARNPRRFKQLRHFDTEYVALHRPADLLKIFHVRMQPVEYNGLPMNAYHHWYRETPSKALQDLIPQQRLETWLHKLFLKIALPTEKEGVELGNIILSPLNLSTFFCVLRHLHSIGYPAHWLSNVLSQLLSGSITTKARPPRSQPLTVQELDAQFSELRQSIAPFVLELSTLASMWQPVLPFGFISSAVAPAESISKFSVTFREVEMTEYTIPHFALVIWKDSLVRRADVNPPLRPYLLSDEEGYNFPAAMDLRDAGIHVLSSWTFERSTSTATFWVRRDAFQEMTRSGLWDIGIWRTDNWEPHTPLGQLRANLVEVKDLGVSWTEESESLDAAEHGLSGLHLNSA